MKFFKQKETYISEQMKLCGDIETNADISIDGEMHGNIKSKGHVMLGPTAHFEGNIESDSVLICGHFKGIITAKQLIEVKIPADIIGDLIADSVRVDSGVAIHGKICAKSMQDQACIPAIAGGYASTLGNSDNQSDSYVFDNEEPEEEQKHK